MVLMMMVNIEDLREWIPLSFRVRSGGIIAKIVTLPLIN